jgi:SAM-dependent methyltransferase
LGDVNKINFEIDPLPYEDNSIDTVIMFNILEHIFNHQFLVNQANRVLKPESDLIGFVPFLVNYHPDPHDYFRYTKEALNLILNKAGFKKIEIKEVGIGPFMVNYNNILLSLPIFLRVVLFPAYYLLDIVFVKIRPQVGHRYPLGYIFKAVK